MSGPPTELRSALADYLCLRRALGFKLANAARLLGQFVDYLDGHAMGTVTVDNALSWAALPDGVSATWLAIRVSVVRGFASYLHGIDPATEVVPAGVVRAGPCRATPYLYSGTEIAAVMAVAATLRPALRATTYQTLVGLLACTGMRIGEAIALDDGDVDVERCLLVVRDTKFGKTRLVPLQSSALAALQRYMGLRDELRRRPASPALLVSTAGTRLWHSNIDLTFARLAATAGLTRRSAGCRPRVHDMRHTFAVNSLLDCYARGADVAAMMAQLATFLGHSDPKHTYWYLSAAPELMALAAQRLETHNGGAS